MATKEPESSPARRRIDGIAKWLRENHPEVFDEQKHLDDGSVERAYWHYGYLVALRDINVTPAALFATDTPGDPHA